MKPFILDNGWENLDKAFFIAGANCGVAANRNPIHEWIDIPMQAFLIKHEDGYILFDTGCDRQIKVSSILYDSVGYKKTVRYLLGYARKTNSTIWYGHDIKQFTV